MNIYTVQIDLYKLSVITNYITSYKSQTTRADFLDVQRTHNEVRDNNCKTKAD